MSKARKTSRRQFLSGEAAVEALGDLTQGVAERGERSFSHPATARSGETFLVQLSRTAMACEFTIFLTADHPTHAPEAALEALDLIDHLEDQLTVYRDHSEICEMNRLAAKHSVDVEPQLFGLLQRCRWLYDETDAAFDITSGPLSKAWGFFRREGKVPSEGDLQAVRECVGGNHVSLDEQQSTVRFSRDGIELNLGGIGKGYALDRAAALLQSRGVDNFLFHGGRSSVLARGSRIPADAETNPWSVGIGHPRRPDRRLGILALRDKSMSTSGTATQSFHHQGRRFGHILDPRTAMPAEGVLSVTTLCDDAATADALSTAFYVMGPEKTEAFCQRHPEVSALVVLPTTGGQQVEVLSINLPDDVWQPL
jgi:thiamine biosynthesis lipoprotein